MKHCPEIGIIFLASVSTFLYVWLFVQCIDAVGWVFWPVKGKENPYRKPVSEMTYNVFDGTLNPAQPNWYVCHAYPVLSGNSFWHRLEHCCVPRQKLACMWLKWWCLRYSSANGAVIVKTAAMSSILALSSVMFVFSVPESFFSDTCGTKHRNWPQKSVIDLWCQFLCCVSWA